ncbi:virB8 family protein [Serratia proteamaculans]|uniref:virB8 family protein n=1 Tax=Serratia proteamaculans TaxID=28151 RepID=UPI003D07A1B6
MRRNKNDVIEREKLLASSPELDPATAREMGHVQRAFIEAGKWFEANVAIAQEAKATMWRRIAAFNGLLAFMAIGAVLGLTPLKEFVPFVVRVDSTTGASDVLRPASEVKSQEQVDDEFMLAYYVRARESYDFADNDSQYKQVELLSHSEAFTEYRNFQLSKKGYLEVLGNTRKIRTDINNIVFLLREDGKGTAQVRITKTVLDRNGIPDQTIKPVKWQVLMSYDYKNKPKTRGDSWLNPRGFGALTYTRSEEVGGKL